MVVESTLFTGTGVNEGNDALLRKCTGVDCNTGVIFRSCTGWYKGNVANKSHGLSIRVTRVPVLAICTR